MSTLVGRRAAFAQILKMVVRVVFENSLNDLQVTKADILSSEIT